LSGLREKVEEGFTAEFAEGTERGPLPHVLHKDVIPNQLHMLVVQGYDSKGVLDVEFRSNGAWALHLVKVF
jgi:hypothetical protein